MGGGDINLQLFALVYNKVDNPCNFTLNKKTYVKGTNKSTVAYNLREYYKKIPNYSTITKLPKENADYIKEGLPNVTDCSYMLGNNERRFPNAAGCKKLTSIDSTGWDVSNIKNMASMFGNCKSLTILDVSKWDTSNVTNMSGMFYNCTSLTTITGIIDMKSCTNYSNMFSNCSKLTGVKIKNPPSGITATSGIGGLAAGKYTIVS